MNYFLDCEFDGFGGDLLSLALIRQDGRPLYIVLDRTQAPCTSWVEENVLPLMEKVPGEVPIWNLGSSADVAHTIRAFLGGDPRPHIIADWPDDIAYFCKALMTAPGEMVAIHHMTFEMMRVQAYPTTLPGAVQHNAYWDAMAMRHLFVKS